MCVYDGVPYSGMITDYDVEYVEEKSLSRIALGHNDSSGPCEMTYDYQYVLSLVPPPSTVTHRHVWARHKHVASHLYLYDNIIAVNYKAVFQGAGARGT